MDIPEKNKIKNTPDLLVSSLGEKRRVGRPTKYKEEYGEALIVHMAKGYSFESFGGVIKVSTDSLYLWVKNYSEFSDAKKIGVNVCRLFWERIGLLGVAGKILNFQTGAWIFNMKNRFGWKDKHEITGGDGERIKIELAYKNPKIKDDNCIDITPKDKPKSYTKRYDTKIGSPNTNDLINSANEYKEDDFN